MINFKANFITETSVKRLRNEKEYATVPAYLVELDISSRSNLKALQKLSKSWENGDLYAADVCLRFQANQEKPENNYGERFFVLTRQNRSWEKLDYRKILGVAELYEPSDTCTEIEFLQTNPKYLREINPKMKNIGKSIVEAFIEMVKSKEFSLFTTPTAKMFYEKLGFVNVESNLMRLKR